MSMVITQSGNNAHQPAYIVASSTTTATTTTAAINDGNETPTLCDIKILCTQRKKKSKRYTYLTFVESCSISTSDEQPCIEIIGKTNSLISLDECISFEYFDTIKNDFQSFINIYFQSYTISIYFSEEHMTKKPFIIKHLDYMYQTKTDMYKQPSSQDLPCLSGTEHILHTFDVKLIPYETIISRDHILIGQARLYFTTTDLYIASTDCNRAELKTTIMNQCPSKDNAILCIPYFTIKHYGNRSNIFLIELGKSNYGNGEIHMKCLSSSLASTIHLLASPVIEERPLILSSAFQNQLLTTKRMAKSKHIHPPIQLSQDTTNQPIVDSLLPLIKKHSIESTSQQSNESNKTKPRTVAGFFRKLLKTTTPLRRSYTFNSNQDHLDQQSSVLPPLTNKFFEFNIEENNSSIDQNRVILPKSQVTVESFETNETSFTSSSNKQETTIGTYIDMGPTDKKSDQNQQEEIADEEIVKETTATVDIGVNTTISLPSYIRSAIIVGTSVHLIAEERAVFPIGQRSFTSPASVMQPFKALLSGQATINSLPTSTDMITCAPNSSSSFHQPLSASNSQQSLLLSYGIVTFNKTSFTTDQTEVASNPLSDGSTIDCRLNSDVSIMSVSHQQQPSNIYSLNNILSSSSSSPHIFRTLSFPTNNIGDNTSGQILTPHGSIIYFDENSPDQTTTYLLGPPPPLASTDDTTSLSRLSSTNLTTSISRTHLSHIDEEKVSSNDPYALIEPLSLHNSSLSSLSTSRNKSSLSSEKSIDYVDLLLPSNTGDEQQELNSSDDNNIDQYNALIEEKNEQSSTILYTGIDFLQTQRRDRIAQFALISKMEDQAPPFVL